MKNIELLSCPFCGSMAAPRIRTLAERDCIENPDRYETSHYCVVCSAPYGGCGASIGNMDAVSEEAAAEQWNRRAVDPPEVGIRILMEAFD